MENLLEILIPLVFVVLYVFGSLFSGKDKDDAIPGGESEGRGGEPEEDPMEQQRRIQEEIRRKIESRGKAREEPEWGRNHEPQAPLSREAEKQGGRVGPTIAPQQQKASGPWGGKRGFSWDTTEDPHSEDVYAYDEDAYAYEKSSKDAYSTSTSPYGYGDAQKDQQKLEETRRRARELKQDVEVAKQEIGTASIGTPPQRRTQKPAKRGGKQFGAGPVREVLNNPRAARTAFIYGEVLGAPVGLRRGRSDVPGLRES
ncbi:MAG: hypothetical protein ACLFUF_00550 [Opitutales bacterium]